MLMLDEAHGASSSHFDRHQKSKSRMSARGSNDLQLMYFSQRSVLYSNMTECRWRHAAVWPAARRYGNITRARSVWATPRPMIAHGPYPKLRASGVWIRACDPPHYSPPDLI